MSNQADSAVNPEAVKNLCIELIEALATSAAISDDQIVPVLAAKQAELMLPIMCVTHLWAADCLARLTGIEATVDPKESLRGFVSTLPISQAELLVLAGTQDEASLLFLATAQDALRMIDLAIQRKLKRLPIGEQYLNFLKSGDQEILEQLLKGISPKRGYRLIKESKQYTDDDRQHDIRVGFCDFLARIHKTPVGDWKDFPHTVIGDHRPVPPEWDNAAKEFFIDEIRTILPNDLSILNGKLENARLEMMTVVRSKYRQWYGIELKVRDGKTKEIKPQRLDLELISLELSSNSQEDEGRPPQRIDGKEPQLVLYESLNPLDSEDLLDQKRALYKLDSLRKTEPEVYRALIESETKTGRFNMAAAARIVGITPQGLTKKLQNILK